MELINGFESLTQKVPHAVVTIGNFDGVHLGHQKIIKLAIEKARARSGKCIAYTFRPHPQVALKSGVQFPLLTTYDEKINILSDLGVDITIEEPFSREFSSIEPEQFFNEALLKTIQTESIVVGYDFKFGKERHGHLLELERLCMASNVELTVVEPQQSEGDTVSSSRIRKYLVEGSVESAHRLLGRPFSYQGIVIKGEARGRKIGFPTANLKLENKLALPYGVYATWAIANGKSYRSVTNVGVRPTFQSGLASHDLPVLVETHLLDTEIDLYGIQLTVLFHRQLRAEKKFNSGDELKAQIGKDIQIAREILAEPL